MTIISITAGLLLQALAQAAVPPAPPPPPPPPPRRVAPARAKANLGALVSDRDYPSEALRKFEEGPVGFRLQIGADGRVTGCRVTVSSGSALLDSATCRIMSERARFTAARDSNGKPTTDTFNARIIWRIDDGSGPSLFEPALAVETIRGTPDGRVTCQLVVNGAPPETETCPADLADPIEATARKTRRVIEQTTVTIMTPTGIVEPTDHGSRGTLLAESDAVFRVAADGSVAECRVMSSKVHRPGAQFGTSPSACDSFMPGPRVQFERAASAAGPRTATVKLRLYGRR